MTDGQFIRLSLEKSFATSNFFPSELRDLPRSDQWILHDELFRWKLLEIKVFCGFAFRAKKEYYFSS
jgi:hypothetical protein